MTPEERKAALEAEARRRGIAPTQEPLGSNAFWARANRRALAQGMGTLPPTEPAFAPQTTYDPRQPRDMGELFASARAIDDDRRVDELAGQRMLQYRQTQQIPLAGPLFAPIIDAVQDGEIIRSFPGSMREAGKVAEDASRGALSSAGAFVAQAPQRAPSLARQAFVAPAQALVRVASDPRGALSDAGKFLFEDVPQALTDAATSPAAVGLGTMVSRIPWDSTVGMHLNYEKDLQAIALEEANQRVRRERYERENPGSTTMAAPSPELIEMRKGASQNAVFSALAPTVALDVAPMIAARAGARPVAGALSDAFTPAAPRPVAPTASAQMENAGSVADELLNLPPQRAGEPPELTAYRNALIEERNAELAAERAAMEGQRTAGYGHADALAQRKALDEATARNSENPFQPVPVRPEGRTDFARDMRMRASDPPDRGAIFPQEGGGLSSDALPGNARQGAPFNPVEASAANDRSLQSRLTPEPGNLPRNPLSAGAPAARRANDTPLLPEVIDGGGALSAPRPPARLDVFSPAVTPFDGMTLPMGDSPADRMASLVKLVNDFDGDTDAAIKWIEDIARVRGRSRGGDELADVSAADIAAIRSGAYRLPTSNVQTVRPRNMGSVPGDDGIFSGEAPRNGQGRAGRGALDEDTAGKPQEPELWPGYNLDADRLIEEAVEQYRVTQNNGAAGYILPDGRMLNFSEAGGGGARTLDHRDVAGLSGLTGQFDNDSDAMIAFMNATDAVRYDASNGLFETQWMPSRRQIEIAVREARARRMPLTVEASSTKGNHIDMAHLDRPTVDEVEAWFKEVFRDNPPPRAPAPLPGNSGRLAPEDPEGIFSPASPRNGQTPSALDMSTEARMARAREMGFDTEAPLYHGTMENAGRDAFMPSRGGELGPGTYVTRDPNLANDFARSSYGGDYREGAGVLPVYAPRLKEFSGVNEQGLMENGWAVERGKIMDRLRAENGGEWSSDIPMRAEMELERVAREEGFAGFYVNGRGGMNQGVVFDPTNIRSVHAAFDPARRDSSDLLAGLSGLGVASTGGALALGMSPDAEADEIVDPNTSLGGLQILPPTPLPEGVQFHGDRVIRANIGGEKKTVRILTFKGPDGTLYDRVGERTYPDGGMQIIGDLGNSYAEDPVEEEKPEGDVFRPERLILPALGYAAGRLGGPGVVRGVGGAADVMMMGRGVLPAAGATLGAFGQAGIEGDIEGAQGALPFLALSAAEPAFRTSGLRSMADDINRVSGPQAREAAILDAGRQKRDVRAMDAAGAFPEGVSIGPFDVEDRVNAFSQSLRDRPYPTARRATDEITTYADEIDPDILAHYQNTNPSWMTAPELSPYAPFRAGDEIGDVFDSQGWTLGRGIGLIPRVRSPLDNRVQMMNAEELFRQQKALETAPFQIEAARPALPDAPKPTGGSGLFEPVSPIEDAVLRTQAIDQGVPPVPGRKGIEERSLGGAATQLSGKTKGVQRVTNDELSSLAERLGEEVVMTKKGVINRSATAKRIAALIQERPKLGRVLREEFPHLPLSIIIAAGAGAGALSDDEPFAPMAR